MVYSKKNPQYHHTRTGKLLCRYRQRNSLLSDTAYLTAAFGLHKMLDMAGSAIGILLAFLLIKSIGKNADKTVYALSVISTDIALFLFSSSIKRKMSGENGSETIFSSWMCG
ncbi:hypothetical protein AALA98_17595 [Lachnospiraceae bacterium 45-W7]